MKNKHPFFTDKETHDFLQDYYSKLPTLIAQSNININNMSWHNHDESSEIRRWANKTKQTSSKEKDEVVVYSKDNVNFYQIVGENNEFKGTFSTSHVLNGKLVTQEYLETLEQDLYTILSIPTEDVINRFRRKYNILIDNKLNLPPKV